MTKENGIPHHTNEYELMEREKPRLVARRGQAFSITLNTNRAMDSEKDKLSLVFTVAGK